MSFGNERDFIDHLQDKEKGGRAMKCPLIHIKLTVNETSYEGQPQDCLKEECAWWDKTYERCDPTGLSHTLERLTDTLAEVERRMPREGQFRK